MMAGASGRWCRSPAIFRCVVRPDVRGGQEAGRPSGESLVRSSVFSKIHEVVRTLDRWLKPSPCYIRGKARSTDSDRCRPMSVHTGFARS